MSKPKGSGGSASANGPREAAPRPDRSRIALKPRTFAEKAERYRALKSIYAREDANRATHRYLNSGAEADHAASVRAGARAAGEARMFDRYMATRRQG